MARVSAALWSSLYEAEHALRYLKVADHENAEAIKAAEKRRDEARKDITKTACGVESA
jgi:hypothetical protein